MTKRTDADHTAVLVAAEAVLNDLNCAVSVLTAHAQKAEKSLSRYTFTTLVSAEQGVMTPTEFEGIGGLPTVRKVIRILYDKVKADPTLAPYFENADLLHIQQQQVQMFLALLGAKDYEGVNLTLVHAPYDISKYDFQILVRHLGHALQEVGMPFDDAEELLDKVRSFQDHIVKESA